MSIFCNSYFFSIQNVSLFVKTTDNKYMYQLQINYIVLMSQLINSFSITEEHIICIVKLIKLWNARDVLI